MPAPIDTNPFHSARMASVKQKEAKSLRQNAKGLGKI